MEPGRLADSLTSAFAPLDESGTGYISVAELEGVWTELGIPLESLSRLIKRSGCSQKDGRAEYAMLFRWICCGACSAEPEPEAIPYPPACPESAYTEQELNDINIKYLGRESIFEALESGDTVLIKGTWLVEHARRGLILPRRQDLPPEAIWEVDRNAWPDEPPSLQVRHRAAWLQEGDVALAALSYCWATPEHPDPTGEQLGRVARVVQMMLSRAKEVLIFIDWCSIYQAPRTDVQLEAFKRALRNVNLWYAHQLIFSLLLTVVPEGVVPYVERGWPAFEFAISGLVKHSNMFLDMAGVPQDTQVASLEDLKSKLIEPCRISRPAPCTPLNFRKKLDSLKFTNGSDRAFVMKKYLSTFQEVIASTPGFAFTNLNWGAQEGRELAEALPWCSSLHKIDLTNCSISTEGIGHMARALKACPTLRTLDVGNCGLGDAGVKHLVGVLGETGLVNLWLAKNGIGDDGASLLADMLEGKDCKLCELSLNGNLVTEVGVRRLAAALRSEGCRLELLRLNNLSSIGDASAEALAAGAKESSRLETLDLRNTALEEAGRKRMKALMEECPRLKVLL